MTSLDDQKQIKKLDRGKMAEQILSLPKQLDETLKKIEKIELDDNFKQVKNVCLAGMGGSAAAGSLIANLPAEERKVPLTVLRSYELPAWVEKTTLVILISHSGNTRETLAVAKKSIRQGAKIFTITTGGDLEKFSQKQGVPIFKYKNSAPARACLGYQLAALAGLLKKLNLINLDFQAALSLSKKVNTDYEISVPTKENLAKKMAYACLDRLPIIIGSGITQSVAWRWKTQFNENAKQLAYTEFLPEAMHNAIEGLTLPAHLSENLIYLILENSFDLPELVRQREEFKNILTDKKIRYEVIEALGDDVFSQKLSTLLLGDWTSFYLAMLNDLDPSITETIEQIKKNLD